MKLTLIIHPCTIIPNNIPLLRHPISHRRPHLSLRSMHRLAPQRRLTPTLTNIPRILPSHTQHRILPDPLPSLPPHLNIPRQLPSHPPFITNISIPTHTDPERTAAATCAPGPARPATDRHVVVPETEVCAEGADEGAGEDVDAVVVEVEPAGDADEDCGADWEVH